MAKPLDLVIVRHGQSEANLVQRDEKNGVRNPQLKPIYDRPDFQQRLSDEGAGEAEIAGAWLRKHGLDPADFDERYVSPFYRTMETAALLGGTACEWLPEVRIIERDWGIYGATPLSERPEMFPLTHERRSKQSFFTRYDNGESMSDVIYRVRDFIGTLDREMGDQRVLAVSHGELMWAMRFVIERMLPEQWQKLDLDKSLRIGNCCILWYSRRNPDNPADITNSLSTGWRRMVYPVNPDTSPYGGKWQRLEGKKRLNGNRLLEIVSAMPRLCELGNSNSTR